MTSLSRHFLDQFKVGSQLLFAGNLSNQPSFQDVKYRIASVLTNTDIAMNQTLWLGAYPALGNTQLDFICEKIEYFFSGL
jgi:CDP-4-dehydro-6-deoxyglucose reductase, E1